MSSEGSVAPKERVNIVYKSDNNGVEEDVELPLKVLVAGEFSTKKDNNSIEQRELVKVNRFNFNDVMKEQDLSLSLMVPNKLQDESEYSENNELALNLNFQSIKDFEPDSLVQSVPELKKLLELREALKALKGPLGNIPDFRKKIDKLIDDDEIKSKLLNELEIKDK